MNWLIEVRRLFSRNLVEIDKGKPLFQLFFLRDNEDQSVEVAEVEEIDFKEVKKHLENGESVFITLKRKEKSEKSLAKEEGVAEARYFTHV